MRNKYSIISRGHEYYAELVRTFTEPCSLKMNTNKLIALLLRTLSEAQSENWYGGCQWDDDHPGAITTDDFLWTVKEDIKNSQYRGCWGQTKYKTPHSAEEIFTCLAIIWLDHALHREFFSSSYTGQMKANSSLHNFDKITKPMLTGVNEFQKALNELFIPTFDNPQEKVNFILRHFSEKLEKTRQRRCCCLFLKTKNSKKSKKQPLLPQQKKSYTSKLLQLSEVIAEHGCKLQ